MSAEDEDLDAIDHVEARKRFAAKVEELGFVMEWARGLRPRPERGHPFAPIKFECRIYRKKDGPSLCIETPFTMGWGAALKTAKPVTVDEHRMFKRASGWLSSRGFTADDHAAIESMLARAKPDIVDVLGSLCMDAIYGDSITFPDWANDLGYDPDSIKALGVYNLCVDVGQKLYRMVGAADLRLLTTLAHQF